MFDGNLFLWVHRWYSKDQYFTVFEVIGFFEVVSIIGNLYLSIPNNNGGELYNGGIGRISPVLDNRFTILPPRSPHKMNVT